MKIKSILAHHGRSPGALPSLRPTLTRLIEREDPLVVSPTREPSSPRDLFHGEQGRIDLGINEPVSQRVSDVRNCERHRLLDVACADETGGDKTDTPTSAVKHDPTILGVNDDSETWAPTPGQPKHGSGRILPKRCLNNIASPASSGPSVPRAKLSAAALLVTDPDENRNADAVPIVLCCWKLELGGLVNLAV